MRRRPRRRVERAANSGAGARQRNRILFHRTRQRPDVKERATEKPSKNAQCRGPESDRRHMVLQVNLRPFSGFVPEWPRHVVWFGDKPVGYRRLGEMSPLLILFVP